MELTKTFDTLANDHTVVVIEWLAVNICLGCLHNNLYGKLQNKRNLMKESMDWSILLNNKRCFKMRYQRTTVMQTGKRIFSCVMSW